MYVIVLGVFILKVQISVSDPEFPAHIDLQKVGEAIFNNEKFNILRPTTHIVTDHFKDYMLRREISINPSKRVFIDDNGFRHAWSGFGEKSKSLRKTDLKYVSGSFENAAPKSDNITTDGNETTTATVEDTTIPNNKDSGGDNEQGEANIASDNNNKVLNLTKEDSKTPDSKTTIKSFLEKQENKLRTEITIETSLRSGEEKTKAKKADDGKEADDDKKASDGKKADDDKKASDGKEAGDGKKADDDKKASDGKKAGDGKKADDDKKASDGKKAGDDKKADDDKKASDGKKAGDGKKGDGKKKKGKKSDSGKKSDGGKKSDSGKKDASAKKNDKKTDGDKANKNTGKSDDKKDKERTVVTTTFFCPFFGVITMSAFID